MLTQKYHVNRVKTLKFRIVINCWLSIEKDKKDLFTVHVEPNVSKDFRVSYHIETPPLRSKVTENENVTPIEVVPRL